MARAANKNAAYSAHNLAFIKHEATSCAQDAPFNPPLDLVDAAKWSRATTIWNFARLRTMPFFNHDEAPDAKTSVEDTPNLVPAPAAGPAALIATAPELSEDTDVKPRSASETVRTATAMT